MPLEHVDENFSYKDIALMPLRGSILLTMLGLAVLLLMATMAGPLFGGLLYIISIVALVRYAQIIISKTLRGYPEPPPLSPKDFNVVENYGALGFYVLLFVLGLAGGLIGELAGPIVHGLFSVLVIISLPAMLAATVLENSLLSAINPVLITRAITTIGKRYFGVMALVTAGYFGSSAVADIINWPYLNVLTSIYGVFLLSCGVGRLLYASRTELGLNITTRQDLIKQEDDKYHHIQDSDALKVAVQTATLSPIQASQSLWDYHQRVSSSLERKWKGFEALKKWDNPHTALRFAQPFAAHLLEQDFKDQALEVVRWAFNTEANFRLAEADTTYALGSYAAALSQYKLAALIMQDMGKRYPDYPHSIAAVVSVGKLAAEKLNHTGLLQSAIEQLRNLNIADTDPRLQTLTRYARNSSPRQTSSKPPAP